MLEEKKILLIEDSATQGMKLILIFETEGWSVVLAKSAEEAMKILNVSLPDLVVLDYNLPGMRGDKLCKKLRMDTNTRSIPIIMLTSEEDEKIELKGLDSGADYYFTKSGDEDLLILRIRNLLKNTVNNSPVIDEATSTFQKAKVLAVDDSPTYLQFLSELLSLEGYQVEKAISGKEALALIKITSFDCILLDLIMPDMDGIEVMKQINLIRTSLSKPVAVLMLTARETKEDMTNALEVGADDFVGKTSDIAVLKGRIKALLRRKFYQEENQRINDELTKKELETVRMRLEKDALVLASQFKSDFVATMSHEIRTPMNGIIGMTDLLLGTELSDEQKHFAKIIKTSSNTLLRILNDVLDFSKIESGKMDIEYIEFDLCPLVEDTVELMAAKAREKGISLYVKIGENIPKVVIGDPGRVGQILLNLVSNAIKFTHQGFISVNVKLISLTNGLANIAFEVKDSGIGLTELQKDKLFQAFSQADSSTTRKYGGTGLGLSISKRLVELMNGSIGVDSNSTEGSNFNFKLPLKVSERLTMGDPRESINLSGVKILLVDDQPISMEVLSTYLRSANAEVVEVSDGKEVLGHLRDKSASNNPFSLVILDLMMPEQDGIDLYKMIKMDPVAGDVKSILVTAFDKAEQRDEVLKLGFSAYLIKPVKKLDLLDIVSTISTASSAIGSSKGNDSSLNKIGEYIPGQNFLTAYILVAEDNVVNRELVGIQLEKLGFKSHIVANGREAVEAFKLGQYSLILMDCEMPEMDGYEATQEIRLIEKGQLTHIPIVAMTAKALKGDREKCLAIGMDDHVTKPIMKNELGRVIENWLKKAN